MSEKENNDNRFLRKLLRENVRIARRELMNAKSNITSIEPRVNLGLDVDLAPKCIRIYNKTVIGSSEQDDLSIFTCDKFCENKVCEDTQCVCYPDNVKYIAAAEKEKTAVHVKRDFNKQRWAEFCDNIIGFFRGKQREDER